MSAYRREARKAVRPPLPAFARVRPPFYGGGAANGPGRGGYRRNGVPINCGIQNGECGMGRKGRYTRCRRAAKKAVWPHLPAFARIWVVREVSREKGRRKCGITEELPISKAVRLRSPSFAFLCGGVGVPKSRRGGDKQKLLAGFTNH